MHRKDATQILKNVAKIDPTGANKGISLVAAATNQKAQTFCIETC